MEIRTIESLEGIAAAGALWRDVWNAPPHEQVPSTLLRAMTRHTCLLLGAFGAHDPERPVGAVLGWWGRDDDGTLFLFSSKLGVAEAHRGAGVAAALKHEQARVVRERGGDELRWTFDPMRARNAAFNLRTLGAVATRFYEDCYGPRSDALNAGQRTDRLLARWRPGEARPAEARETRRIAIPEDRDLLRDALCASFADGLRATGFEGRDTYVMTR